MRLTDKRDGTVIIVIDKPLYLKWRYRSPPTHHLLSGKVFMPFNYDQNCNYRISNHYDEINGFTTTSARLGGLQAIRFQIESEVADIGNSYH